MMPRLALYTLAFGLLVGATSTFAQDLSKPMRDGLQKAVITYNECILTEFNHRLMIQEAADLEKGLLQNAIASCEGKASFVRAFLAKVPGATKEKVDEQLNKLRSVAGTKLLAILAVLILASEPPADSKR
jgi:hypothetical protein